MQEICLRDGDSPNGLSPIPAEVSAIVLNPAHWHLNEQLIRLCKPLVDAVGNLESRDATLADCMLELIWAERQIATVSSKDTDDIAFTQHAQTSIRTGFHKMNTDLHWFALFLHPLARTLAISSATHSRQLDHALYYAAHLVAKWGWSCESVTKLLKDIQVYAKHQAPFTGGTANAKDWWAGLIVDAADYPIKSLSLRIFSIVPHAAEIERLFSDLGGFHTPRRCRLTVAHMETLGVLRNHYTAELSGGKPTHRPHAHMHTRTGGLDLEKLTELESLFDTNTESESEAAEPNAEDLAGPEDVSLAELEQAFRLLQTQGDMAMEEGDGMGRGVGVEDVYAVGEMARIRQGLARPTPDQDAAEHDGVAGASGGSAWNPDDILRSMGVSRQS